MGVSWATSNATTPATYAAYVIYGNATGPNAGKLVYTSKVADSRSYSVCNAQSPFLHFATMTGLVAGQQYYYSIDGGKECGVTPPKLFTAPKVVGAPAAQTYPFTMLAYADMGISNSEYTAAFIAQKVSARCLRFRDWAAWLAWRARRAKASPHPHSLRTALLFSCRWPASLWM